MANISNLFPYVARNIEGQVQASQQRRSIVNDMLQAAQSLVAQGMNYDTASRDRALREQNMRLEDAARLLTLQQAQKAQDFQQGKQFPESVRQFDVTSALQKTTADASANQMNAQAQGTLAGIQRADRADALNEFLTFGKVAAPVLKGLPPDLVKSIEDTYGKFSYTDKGFVPYVLQGLGADYQNTYGLEKSKLGVEQQRVALEGKKLDKLLADMDNSDLTKYTENLRKDLSDTNSTINRINAVLGNPMNSAGLSQAERQELVNKKTQLELLATEKEKELQQAQDTLKKRIGMGSGSTPSVNMTRTESILGKIEGKNAPMVQHALSGALFDSLATAKDDTEAQNNLADLIAKSSVIDVNQSYMLLDLLQQGKLKRGMTKQEIDALLQANMK